MTNQAAKIRKTIISLFGSVTDQCRIASAAMVATVGGEVCSCKVNGWDHYLVLVDGRYVDCTADQFDSAFPAVVEFTTETEPEEYDFVTVDPRFRLDGEEADRLAMVLETL